MSRIAYGCGSLGDATAAQRVIHTAFDHGITFFDLADVYGLGSAESTFGEVLKRSPGIRERIVIQSKCGIYVPEQPQWDDPLRFNLSREHIMRSVEGSLQRLGTDRLDILMLHASDALVEPEELAQAFDDLHRSGKARYFGVSNHSRQQIELLRKYLQQPLVANQMHLGLAQAYRIAGGMDPTRDDSVLSALKRAVEELSDALDDYRVHEMQVQAYCPLRLNTLNAPALLNPSADAPPEIKQTAQMLADLARKYAVAPSAVALAWLLRHPARIVPVIGATNPEHVIENCGADRIVLEHGEWYALFAAVAGVQLGQMSASEKSS